MSAKAKAMKQLYRMGRVSAAALKKAVTDGVLTQAEYDAIVSQ